MNFQEEYFNSQLEAASELRPGREEERRWSRRARTRRHRHHNEPESEHQQLRQPGLRRVHGAGGTELLRRSRFPRRTSWPPSRPRRRRRYRCTRCCSTPTSPITLLRRSMRRRCSRAAPSALPARKRSISRAPLAHTDGFITGRRFAPFYLSEGQALAKLVQQEIQAGTLSHLFIVLRLPPSPFPGVSAIPPLIGLDGGVTHNDAPIFGLSYVSTDGVTFNRSTTFNFRFSPGSGRTAVARCCGLSVVSCQLSVPGISASLSEDIGCSSSWNWQLTTENCRADARPTRTLIFQAS